ncbi:unnamed protein product [Penicillium nalgiovense]|nr:unnamed protein product [Penicillium nalgiovense]
MIIDIPLDHSLHHFDSSLRFITSIHHFSPSLLHHFDSSLPSITIVFFFFFFLSLRRFIFISTPLPASF